MNRGSPPDIKFIRLGGRALEYRFAQRRRRTLGINVDAGGLAVAAPLYMPLRDVESFLREKERWILRKLDHWARFPPATVLRVASGETVPLLGRALTLEVRKGKRAVMREDDRLVVYAPGAIRVAETLVAWLKARALETLAPRVGHFAARLGLPAPQVVLSSARSRWGTCTHGGLIRLNWRLVHLAPAFGDYVAAHEAAHLVELNHSKRFWSLLAGLYPAWREARRQLVPAGAAIPIIGGSIREAR